MYCPKCGTFFNEQVSFCGKCGAPMNVSSTTPAPSMPVSSAPITAAPQTIPQNIPTPQAIPQHISVHQAVNPVIPKKKKRSPIVIGIITFCSIFLFFIAIFLVASAFQVKNRTILIYMAGANLESEAGIASADLSSIDYSTIDLKTTNVLVYAGGAKRWYNKFNPMENAIYKLTTDGFIRVRQYDLKNMGETNTFQLFLDYVSENYPNTRYDLIFWNHGLGMLGSISDEHTDDYLSIKEMTMALEKSNITKRRKFDSVTFRTCLNSTAEVANVYAKYAKYMVASEEVTVGSASTNVLSFINNLELKDNGFQYGEKFVNSYKELVSKLSFFGAIDSTYAVIDLSKYSKLKDAVNDFFSDISVEQHYADIARVRATLHQYGESHDTLDYDTVDLYQLVDSLKSYSPEKGEKVLSILKEMIVLNWATNDASHGLSIYFPFKGRGGVQNIHMSLYSTIDFIPSYSNFITTFYNIKNNKTSSFAMNLSDNSVQVKDKKEFQLQLTDEQMNNYAYSSYIVFRKEENNYYTPIYSGTNSTLSSEGVLSTHLTDRLIKVVDKENNTEHFIQAYEKESADQYRTYNTVAVLNDFSGDEFVVDPAIITLKLDEASDVHISSVIKSEDEKPNTIQLNLDRYSTIDFGNFRYKILDDQGNYSPNWESNNTYYMIEVKKDQYEFKTSSLDDGEYYCIFKIYDVSNQYTYSKLVKIG